MAKSFAQGIAEKYSVDKVEVRPKRSRGATGEVSDRVKAHITVLEFVGRYVDLKPIEGGAIGLCPFYDDRHPSLSVNDKEDYWNCFAGCGGGSIIDFWSPWRSKQGPHPGFVASVTDLAERLLSAKGDKAK